MKKAILTTATILFLGSTIALAKPGGEGRGIERLQSALGLNETQSAEVENIMQQHRQKMEALRTQMDQSMQSVLTAEQYATFKEMKQRRGRGHKRGERQGRYNNQQQ